MSNNWLVLKFGGTSVSTRKAWENIRDILAMRAEEFPECQVLVVCSAVSKVSDQLDGLLEAAMQERHGEVLDKLRERHQQLADELSLDIGLLDDDFRELERVATGVALTREWTPRLQARVMSRGEFLSTRLGAAFLGVAWQDVRELLDSEDESHATPARRYLSARCAYTRDETLAGKLKDKVVLTQGFVARDARGDTVLLGRGGSDTSAAYLAARIGARRLEIWTDVRGMYTADPRHVPNARLLRRLDYSEAQELASTGAKVLHPRCLPPVARYRIPLHIFNTQEPRAEGTVIASAAVDEGRVKAISTKSRVTLVSLESQKMWQQVGFLADLFGCFRDHGLSVDLVATSETNVTVSLDGSEPLEPGALERLEGDLLRLGQNPATAEGGDSASVRITTGCSSVSLIGNRIRSLLHRLGPALELFEEEQIHLMTQASSDLNLTVVVDSEQAPRLMSSLHALLFSASDDDPLFGPAWQKPSQKHAETWWERRRDDLLKLEGLPAYVYDRQTLSDNVARLRKISSISRVYYAIKANPSREILAVFAENGLGFECVSPGELERARELSPQGHLLYTPNFASREDFEAGFKHRAQVTLDSLEPLELWPDLFRGRELFLRLDPGQGKGHHKHVRTAGPQSKFGIAPAQLEQAHALLQALDIKVIGLHSHRGSGILEPEPWSDTALFLADCAERFGGTVRVLDLGGGLGVGERLSDEGLNLVALDEILGRFLAARPGFELWLEPGRFLVAAAGVLLARVTQVKEKSGKTFVGVETGMNSLIRPALYGAHHEIVNLSRLGEPNTLTADIVGPICESADVLGHDRRLPSTRSGDVLLVATAGAYGRAMSSHYNLREPAREIMV